LWRHRDRLTAPPLSLHDISYDDSAMSFRRRPEMLPDGGLAAYMERARRLVDELVASRPEPIGLPVTTDDFEHLRWFSYPDEA
jgi:hypothetical protein